MVLKLRHSYQVCRAFGAQGLGSRDIEQSIGRIDEHLDQTSIGATQVLHALSETLVQFADSHTGQPFV